MAAVRTAPTGAASLLQVLAPALVLALSTAGANATPADEAQITVTVERQGDAFRVDARMRVPVSPRRAWEVLTDFDHMASIVSNLESSRITSRQGDSLRVHQEGTARYGLLSFHFESEREVHLEAMQRIVSRNLSGSAKQIDSEARLRALDGAVEITYHAEVVPDSVLARLFGTAFIRHEVEEQFREMTIEMRRRQDRLGSGDDPRIERQPP